MVNDNFHRSGGVPIAIRRISEAVPGVDFCFAGCERSGLAEYVAWIPKGQFERFDLKSSNPARVLIELRRFSKWFAQQHCDLAHCHHRRLSALLALTHLPVLYTSHLAFDYALWFRLLHPGQMTAVTPSVATNLRQTTGQPVITCIGNPIQFPERPPEIDLAKVRRRAVCVARLEPIKGHRFLLKAWKALRDRGHEFELDLVGEGSLRPALEEQVWRDGMGEIIRFRGFREDISAILGESLFAVLASANEGQPTATMEAAAIGRASLLTAVPGSVDLLPPQRRLRNGLAFGQSNELADALLEWFTHPEEVVDEGQRFFEFLKMSSDPVVVGREYKALYEQVIAHPI